MAFRRPNPCHTLMLYTMICELSFVCVFRQPQIETYFQNYIVCIVCISLSLFCISSQNPWNQYMMNEDGLIFSDRSLSWRQGYGFKTWRITSGAIWLQGSMRFNTLFSTLQKVLQPGGKCIKPYKDATEQKLGRNSRRLC